MAGRPKTINFDRLGFSITKINNRPVASCNNCGKSFKNTASIRLIAHRKICGELSNVDHHTDIALYTLDEVEVEYIDTVQANSLVVDQVVNEELEISCSPSPGTGTLVIPTLSIESERSTSSSLISDATSSCSGSILRYLTPNYDTPSSSVISSRPRISNTGQISSSSGSFNSNRSSTTTSRAATSNTATSGKRRSMSTFVDVLTPRDKAAITTAIGNFFYGCNIPLRVIESSHFKNLINRLRPSYEKSIPKFKI